MIRDNAQIRRLIEELKDLNKTEWEWIMQFFCHSCGGPKSCKCWNDE